MNAPSEKLRSGGPRNSIGIFKQLTSLMRVYLINTSVYMKAYIGIINITNTIKNIV